MTDAKHDLAAAVGHIAMNGARLEWVVGILQVRLLRSDIGDLVMLGQPWSAMKDACLALIRARETQIGDGELPRPTVDPDREQPELFGYGTDPLDELPALLTRANQLMAIRNSAIHGRWLASTGGGSDIATRLVKRWGKRDDRSWTIESLQQLARDLLHVTNEIAYHVGTLWRWLDE